MSECVYIHTRSHKVNFTHSFLHYVHNQSGGKKLDQWRRQDIRHIGRTCNSYVTTGHLLYLDTGDGRTVVIAMQWSQLVTCYTWTLVTDGLHWSCSWTLV